MALMPMFWGRVAILKQLLEMVGKNLETQGALRDVTSLRPRVATISIFS